MTRFFVFTLSCIALLWCTSLRCAGQVVEVRGVVEDAATLAPLARAIVTVKKNEGRRIVAYASTSDTDGSFSLRIHRDSMSHCYLEIKYIGYASQTIELVAGREYRIKMKAEGVNLTEAVVKAKKIVQRQDTTSYLVSGFATAKDRTIGEVMASMPGIDVAADGRITYNGSPINKFYIEGLDLLDGKYSLATNNISHSNISSVEVIENHQSVKALQKSEPGRETAINLKLKEGAKHRWSGNASARAGASPDGGIWLGELFASRFSAKDQSISTLKTNNSGKNIAGEGKTLTIDDLLNMMQGKDIAGNLHTSLPGASNIDEGLTRFNRTHMFTNSTMWKPTQFSRIKTQIVYTADRSTFDQSQITAYFLADTTLAINTAEAGTLKDHRLEASVKATIDRAEYYLTEELSYSSDWKTLLSVVGGDLANTSVAESNTHRIENKLRFIKTLGGRVFQISSTNSYISLPEHLSVAAASVRTQRIDKSNFFSNTSFKYSYIKGRWTLGANADVFGGIYGFDSEYGGTASGSDVRVNHIAFRLNPDVVYQSGAFRFAMKIPWSVYRFGGEQSGTKAYVKPDAYLRWKFLPRWTATINAALGNEYPGNDYYYTHPVMTDYRSTYKGFIGFAGRRQRRIGGRIGYADPSDMLFANIGITHSSENTRRTMSKQVADGMVHYSYTPGNDRYKLLFVDANVSKGVDPIKGKVELRASYHNNSMPIEQNGASSVYDFGYWGVSLAVTSKPSDLVDISYKAGYDHNFISTSTLSSSTRRFTQSCLITLYPISDLHIRLNASHYLTHFATGQNKNLMVADVQCVYRYKKLDITASVTNLFNQRKYSYTTYTDLSSTYMQYRIRGLNATMGVSWYF